VLLFLAHDGRRVVHFDVTEHPTTKWAAQQIADAFAWDTAPKYLWRGRDQTYGQPDSSRSPLSGYSPVDILTAYGFSGTTYYSNQTRTRKKRKITRHYVTDQAKHVLEVEPR